MLESGATLGKYTILRLLGKGGMGEVYLAREPVLEREVVLKLMNPGLEGVRGALARFTLEARAIASLNSPNIVQIYEFNPSGERPYIAMEYVRGCDMSVYIGKHPQIDLDTFRYLACQLFNGLRCAHAAGIIHRDLKPANILIDGENNLKLTDFGLVRSLHAEEGLTHSGATVGTVEYFPPEVARGEKPGKHSDVYSAAITLYELLTGRLPFTRTENVLQLLQKIAKQQPPPPENFRQDLPAGLRAWFAKCLAHNINERYQDAGEALRELQRLDSRAHISRLPAEESPETVELAPGCTPANTAQKMQPANASASAAAVRLANSDAREIITLAARFQRQAQDCLDETRMLEIAAELGFDEDTARAAIVRFKEEKLRRGRRRRIIALSALAAGVVLATGCGLWLALRAPAKLERQVTRESFATTPTADWRATGLICRTGEQILAIDYPTGARVALKIGEREHLVASPGLLAPQSAGQIAVSAEGAGQKSQVRLVLADKLRIAALPFNGLADYAEACGDVLATRLAQSGYFTVVERVQVDKVLDNLQLEQGSYFDPATAGEIGRMLGTEYLVQGTVQRADNVYRLSARRVDAATGQIAETVEVSGNDLFALQDELAQKLLERLKSAELRTLTAEVGH